MRGLDCPLTFHTANIHLYLIKTKTFGEKIVLTSSFCTNLRISSSSHRYTMLRTRSLASHKNNLIIDDFYGVGVVLTSSFCTKRNP